MGLGVDHEAKVANRLRSAGLRVTPQRRAVCSVFESGADGHFTAEEVFGRVRRELPEISRSTVYNSLGELVRAGLLQRIEACGATLYEPNLDPAHQHFRCRACGGLHDVYLEGEDALRISGSQGFMVEETRVILYGLCPACSSHTETG